MQIYEMLIPLKPPRFYFDEKYKLLKRYHANNQQHKI